MKLRDYERFDKLFIRILFRTENRRKSSISNSFQEIRSFLVLSKSGSRPGSDPDLGQIRVRPDTPTGSGATTAKGPALCALSSQVSV